MLGLMKILYNRQGNRVSDTLLLVEPLEMTYSSFCLPSSEYLSASSRKEVDRWHSVSATLSGRRHFTSPAISLNVALPSARAKSKTSSHPSLGPLETLAHRALEI